MWRYLQEDSTSAVGVSDLPAQHPRTIAEDIVLDLNSDGCIDDQTAVFFIPGLDRVLL
jgi:hypothetical protein